MGSPEEKMDVSAKTRYNAYYIAKYVRSQMILDTYNHQRSDLVQDLINTYDLYLDEPEHLQTPDDLQRFLEMRGIKLEAEVTPTDLDETCNLRETLRTAWNAEMTETMLAILNPLIAASPVTMQFEETGEQHVHAQFALQPGLSLTQQLAFECALGMIEVVQQQGLDRMRACAAAPCRDVFVDTSRNKSRRFCSEQCANRYNISAFRERQKKLEGDGGDSTQ
jgi:predicted RNA-binding Zn ribbon-like protein